VRKIFTVTLAILILFALAFAAHAKKGDGERKWDKRKPAGTYITSAKIEIISGDLDRYPNAINYLEHLFHYYGPHGDGLFLMAQIYVDYLDREPDLAKKKEYVTTVVAYADSLKAACADENIKKKFKKNCEANAEKMDSIKVVYWTDFYNTGIEKLNELTDKANERQAETDAGADSTTIAFFDEVINAKFDSCKTSFEIAIAIDPSQHKSYIGLGTACGVVGKFDEAVQWKEKALDFADDPASLRRDMGYDLIQEGDYCGAIPYLRAFVDENTTSYDADPTSVQLDTVTVFNLSICYNNCQEYEKATEMFHLLLKYDPNHLEALKGMGRYFNQMGQFAGDSISVYDEDADKKAHWQGERDKIFDSALVYFRGAFGVDPSDAMSTEMFAVIAFLKEDFEGAAAGFAKMTEIYPDEPEHFMSAGDAYLKLEQHANAITFYEKSVELKPDEKVVWELLVGLYQEVGDKTKASEAQKKADAL